MIFNMILAKHKSTSVMWSVCCILLFASNVQMNVLDSPGVIIQNQSAGPSCCLLRTAQKWMEPFEIQSWYANHLVNLLLQSTAHLCCNGFENVALVSHFHFPPNVCNSYGEHIEQKHKKKTKNTYLKLKQTVLVQQEEWQQKSNKKNPSVRILSTGLTPQWWRVTLLFKYTDFASVSFLWVVRHLLSC